MQHLYLLTHNLYTPIIIPILRRDAEGVVVITTYAQHGLVNIAKKKRGVKSSQI